MTDDQDDGWTAALPLPMVSDIGSLKLSSRMDVPAILATAFGVLITIALLAFTAVCCHQ
jgi:hypothetical protein